MSKLHKTPGTTDSTPGESKKKPLPLLSPLQCVNCASTSYTFGMRAAQEHDQCDESRLLMEGRTKVTHGMEFINHTREGTTSAAGKIQAMAPPTRAHHHRKGPLSPRPGSRVPNLRQAAWQRDKRRPARKYLQTTSRRSYPAQWKRLAIRRCSPEDQLTMRWSKSSQGCVSKEPVMPRRHRCPVQRIEGFYRGRRLGRRPPRRIQGGL